MALRINLFHEIAKQQQQRRRDPLKLALLALLVIAVGFVAFYFVRLQSVSALKARASKTEAQWTELEQKETTAKTREEELTKVISNSEALTQRIEGRFYWAPMLEQIMRAVPREVQVTRFSGEVSDDKTKKCSITLTGISASEEPRTVAEDLRTTLSNTLNREKTRHASATFRSLEEASETVQLEGKKLPTAAFSIGVEINPNVEQIAAVKPRTQGRPR